LTHAAELVCFKATTCVGNQCNEEKICYLDSGGGGYGFPDNGSGGSNSGPSYDPSINAVKVIIDGSVPVYVKTTGKTVYTTSHNCGDDENVLRRVAQAALTAKPYMQLGTKVIVDMFDEYQYFVRVSTAGSVQFAPVQSGASMQK